MSFYADECRRILSEKKTKCILFIFFIVLIIGSKIVIKDRLYVHNINSKFSYVSQQHLLDGCQYVYIDMGTNIGIQIRKLYEPHLYPGAQVLPLFKEVFGNHSHEVCSVGFEANPVHTNYLKEFENYCLRRNWRVKIFTSTAVSITEKNLTFYTEPGDKVNNQWGASLNLRLPSQKGNVTIPSIDIVSWIKTIVLNRKMPSKFTLPKVMMKSDIEGHDAVVIASLILSEVYCKIDLIYGEHLDAKFLDAVSVLQRTSNSCMTKLIYMDDESYHNNRFPFIINKSVK